MIVHLEAEECFSGAFLCPEMQKRVTNVTG